MKMKMKSLCIALLMILCVIPMTACGSEEVVESTMDPTMTATLEQQVDMYILALSQMTDDQIEQLRTSDDGFTVSAMNAWADNRKEIGEYVAILSSEVEEDEEGLYVVRSEVDFELKDAFVTMHFDPTAGVPTYMTIEVIYSMGELMGQAGMNTLMGVSIVFLVLLFLSVLIGTFKYIGKMTEGKNKAEVKKAAPAAPKAAAPVVEGNLVDDGELVAVIAAAIAASENTSTDSFVVRSIRRKTNNKWSRA